MDGLQSVEAPPVAPWKLVYDSVQGTSHIAHGMPCQDACRAVIHTVENEQFLIVACGDGAGSAMHSDFGSLTACDMVVELCKAQLVSRESFHDITQDTVVNWIETIRQKLQREAERRECTLRDFATTLLIAIVMDDAAFFAQIGDGAIVIRQEGQLRCVFWPQSGEYVNVTNFITGDFFRENLQTHAKLDPITELAIFTDGIERLALRFDALDVHAPFFEPMFRQLQVSSDVETLFAPLRDFLGSDAVNRRTDDDKTLILASRVLCNDHSL